MECLRGNPDCDCKPLHHGDRIKFFCITHEKDTEAKVMYHIAGHTYAAAASCGIAHVSTTQVEVIDEESDTNGR